MTEISGIVEWVDGLAAILENNPTAKAVTVEFAAGGRLRVDRDEGARFIAKGDTLDLDAYLAQESWGLTELAERVGEVEWSL